jgi:hypothetical protein
VARNKFKAALNHIKSTDVDEKIQRLNEAPTNSMSGVYSLNAPGFRVGPKDPARKYLPDIDGNFTDGIPGNPGDPFYLRPEGYWDG